MTYIKQFSLKKNSTTFPKVKIEKSKDSADFIKRFYQDDISIFESFFILLLNRANYTIGYAKISQGGITGTVVDKKIIAKYVIDSLASNIIIAHNHPSGNTTPSDSDIRLTRDIKDVCNLVDCTVLDHVILTEDGYYSFADENII
jgi:DNA repair protein RadC